MSKLFEEENRLACNFSLDIGNSRAEKRVEQLRRLDFERLGGGMKRRVA